MVLMYTVWYMYLGMKDDPILNSCISFYYDLAYWDRSHKAREYFVWFVVDVQKKTKIPL